MTVRKYQGPTGRVYTVENVQADTIKLNGSPDPFWVATGPGGVYVEGRSFGAVMAELRQEAGELEPFTPGPRL